MGLGRLSTRFGRCINSYQDSLPALTASMSLLKLCVPCMITVLERRIGRYQRARSLLVGPMTSSMTFASELIYTSGFSSPETMRLASNTDDWRVTSSVYPVAAVEGGPDPTTNYLFHGASESHSQNFVVFPPASCQPPPASRQRSRRPRTTEEISIDPPYGVHRHKPNSLWAVSPPSDHCPSRNKP